MKSSKGGNNRTQSNKPVDKQRQTSQSPKNQPKKAAAPAKQPQAVSQTSLDGSNSGCSLSVEIFDPRAAESQPTRPADKRASEKHAGDKSFKYADTKIVVPFDPADSKDLAQIAKDFGVNRSTHHVLRYSHRRKGSQTKDYHHKIVSKDQTSPKVPEAKEVHSSKSPVVRKTRANRTSSRQLEEPETEKSMPAEAEKKSKDLKNRKVAASRMDDELEKSPGPELPTKSSKELPASKSKHTQDQLPTGSREIITSKKAKQHRNLSLESGRAGSMLETITRTELMEQLKEVDTILDSVRRDVRTVVPRSDTQSPETDNRMQSMAAAIEKHPLGKPSHSISQVVMSSSGPAPLRIKLEPPQFINDLHSLPIQVAGPTKADFQKASKPTGVPAGTDSSKTNPVQQPKPTPAQPQLSPDPRVQKKASSKQQQTQQPHVAPNTPAQPPSRRVVPSDVQSPAARPSSPPRPAPAQTTTRASDPEKKDNGNKDKRPAEQRPTPGKSSMQAEPDIPVIPAVLSAVIPTVAVSATKATNNTSAPVPAPVAVAVPASLCESPAAPAESLPAAAGQPVPTVTNNNNNNGNRSTVVDEHTLTETLGARLSGWMQDRLGALCQKVLADVRRADVKRRKRIRNHQLLLNKKKQIQQSTQTEQPASVSMSKKNISLSTDRSSVKITQGTSTRTIEDQHSQHNLEVEMQTIIEIKAPLRGPPQTLNLQIKSREQSAQKKPEEPTVEELRERFSTALNSIAVTLQMEPTEIWENLIESVKCYNLTQTSGEVPTNCKTSDILPVNQLLKITVTRMWMNKQVC